MEKRGIDISRYQGKPDFVKVKNDVDYVILQAGFGRYASQKDSEFERSYAECKKNGIPVGVYWYSYARSAAEAVQEAKACMDVIAGKTFEYPIYIDLEENLGALGMSGVSAIAKAFCDELEKAGYFSGIYISRAPAQSYLDDYCRTHYALWLAEYSPTGLHWSGDVGMWQYGNTGRVAGISGDVDMDICYVDYPKLIKQGGFNGYKKPATTYLDKPEEKWYYFGMEKTEDNKRGLYGVKQRMKAKGATYLDDTGGFGAGTEKAVNSFLKEWGYVESGIIGKNFVERIMK